MELNVNDLIEQRYKIVKLINEGGMSYIYLAIDLKLNSRYVAMKLLKKQYISSYELLQHEAMTLSKLNHPYLPTIFDYFTLNSSYEVIVMEYIEGVTLLQICSQLNGWSKLKILAQLASALAYLHERPTPIIHRDIKPSNIMIDQQLNVKMIDFGISAYSLTYMDETENKQAAFGTPSYMAPELLAGEEATIKSDLYSFAILMLYMWNKDSRFLNDLNCNIEFFISQQFKHEHVLFKQLLLTMLQRKPQDRTITFIEVEEQLNYLFYERLHNEENDKRWDKTNHSYNIAVLNLNRQAGSTSIAISLAQHLSQMNRSIAYMEIADEHANAHLSYIRKYEENELDEHSINQVNIKNINFYFKKNDKKQALNKQLEEWQTIIYGISADVIVLDLSSIEERFSLLAALQPIHLLIVVSSPDIHLLPDYKMVSSIKSLRRYNMPIIHIANRQDIYSHTSLLQQFLAIKQYEHIPTIYKPSYVVDLMNGNWLHPKSELAKGIRKRLKRLNFFYKQE